MIKEIRKIIGLGLKFSERKKIIYPYKPKELINLVKEDLPEEGMPLKQIIDIIDKSILPYCVNQGNPKYLAFPDSGNSIEGLIADILKPFLNQNLIADVKSAPIGTYLEIQVIKWFRDLVGYKSKSDYPDSIKEIGGIVCFGGVMSIVIALLVARSKLIKSSFKKGLKRNDVYILFPKGIEHYSKSVAMGYLGLGADNLIPVKLKKDFKMDLKDLKCKIRMIKGNKNKILAVIGYAGDSRTMRIDNIKEISKICREEGIWFHLDACHGGSLLFSDKLKYELNGIEFCDSITLDPHKVLTVPYPCSLVLFKNPEDLMLVSKNYDMTIKKGSYDLGQITPFIGSKSFESLKLWLLIKSKGKRELSEMVEKRNNLANYFKSLIDKDKDLISLHEVNNNSICFAYFPRELKNLSNHKEIEVPIIIDKLNKKIHDNIYQKGDICIHTFKLQDIGNKLNFGLIERRQVLGIILGNPLTTKKDLKECYLIIKDEAKTCWLKTKKDLENEIRI